MSIITIIIGLFVGIVIITIIVLLIGLPISCKAGTSSKTGKTGWFGKACITCPANTYSYQKSLSCSNCPPDMCSEQGSFDLSNCNKNCPTPPTPPEPSPDPGPTPPDPVPTPPGPVPTPPEPDYQCNPTNCILPKVCISNNCIIPEPVPECDASNCPSPKVCYNKNCVNGWSNDNKFTEYKGLSKTGYSCDKIGKTIMSKYASWSGECEKKCKNLPDCAGYSYNGKSENCLVQDDANRRQCDTPVELTTSPWTSLGGWSYYKRNIQK